MLQQNVTSILLPNPQLRIAESRCVAFTILCKDVGVWITSCLNTVKTPTAVALGNFDGVHLGHRQVIQPILRSALNVGHGSAVEPSVLAECLLHSTVVTFRPHPQEFFTGQTRTLLTPIDEKVQHLRHLGVEQLVLLPFDQDLAALTPTEFVERILVQALRVRSISVGQDFCFGCKRLGTSDDLKAIASGYGVAVHIVPLHTLESDRISSSAIRHALHQGDITQANRLLGRPYALVGSVERGQQLGRTLGFPTANLRLPAEKFLPRLGVYAVSVTSPALGEGDRKIPGVMNIGHRPTVAGTHQTVEVHLLDWSGDLYDQTLTVNLKRFLRPEQKFAALADLKAQIQQDVDNARSHLSHLSASRPASISINANP